MKKKKKSSSPNTTNTPKAKRKSQNEAPFSNFANDLPLGINEINQSLMEITNGWPKVVSKTLCVPKGNDVRPLKNQADLFAWIRRQVAVDWKRSGGRAVPLEEFYHCLLDQEREYSWASAHPHFPAAPGVYYLAQAPKPKNTGKVNELLDRFCPKTPTDRELIRCLVLTLFWGGAAGQRPQFVIAADPGEDSHAGRGTGKTKLVEVVSQLVGGCIDIQPGTSLDRILSNLLSPSSWQRRVVLVDNLKTLHYSNGGIESFICRSEITGHRLHHGFSSRPNLLTWIVTVNGASFSTDMARRSVVISLKRPKQASDPWYTDTLKFIEDNRAAIVADIRWHLEVKKPNKLKPAKEDTWADWRKGVLSRCEKPDDLVKRLEERRESIDGDKEDLLNMVTHLRACMAEELPNTSLNVAKVWLPSRVLVQWVQEVKPRYDDWQASTYLKRLPAKQFSFQHRNNGNGYWWTGPQVDPDDPPPPSFIQYHPKHKRHDDRARSSSRVKEAR